MFFRWQQKCPFTAAMWPSMKNSRATTKVETKPMSSWYTLCHGFLNNNKKFTSAAARRTAVSRHRENKKHCVTLEHNTFSSTYSATAHICLSTPWGCISWQALSGGSWCVWRAVGEAGTTAVLLRMIESPYRSTWRCQLPCRRLQEAFNRP